MMDNKDEDEINVPLLAFLGEKLIKMLVVDCVQLVVYRYILCFEVYTELNKQLLKY